MDDKIKKLGEHFSGFDLIKDYDNNGVVTNSFKLLKISIPLEWDVFSKETETYHIEPSREGMAFGVCGLYGTGDIEFSDIIDFALDIIKHNNDKQLKIQLYNEIVENLVDTFNKTSFEKLKTLKIVFESKKKKVTKKINTEKNITNDDKKEIN